MINYVDPTEEAIYEDPRTLSIVHLLHVCARHRVNASWLLTRLKSVPMDKELLPSTTKDIDLSEHLDCHSAIPAYLHIPKLRKTCIAYSVQVLSANSVHICHLALRYLQNGGYKDIMLLRFVATACRGTTQM